MEIESVAVLESKPQESKVKIEKNSSQDEMPIIHSKYDDLIPRKLMEALTGIPVHTIIKYEDEGLITPIKTKSGAMDLVCYRLKDVQTLCAKKGIHFKKRETAEVIAVWSQKGGVGKTATTQHLAGMLSVYAKVLVIDLDSQADLTQMVGESVRFNDVIEEDAELEPTIAELIDWNLEEDYENPYVRLSKEKVIRRITPTLDLIRADLDLGEINYSINTFPIKNEFDDDGNLVSVGKLNLIKKVIEELKHQYDYILLDCPPNIEAIVVNALFAANRILIPVELEAKCLKTMNRNHTFLKRLQTSGPGGKNLGFNWDKVLILPNKFRKENIKMKALMRLQDLYGDGSRGVDISQVYISNSVLIDRCSEEMEPIYLASTRLGKEHRAYVKPGKEFTNLFWIVMHELLDLPIERLPFPIEADADQEM